MMQPHKCDERCVCPIHGTPLWYARGTGEHACQDIECVHAHGLLVFAAKSPTVKRTRRHRDS